MFAFLLNLSHVGNGKQWLLEKVKIQKYIFKMQNKPFRLFVD